MKITYLLPCGRGAPPRALMSGPAKEPCGKPPRLARLVALAHKLDQLVRSRAVKDYAELAQLGHVSPARLSQIMLLLHLAPAIQESYKRECQETFFSARLRRRMLSCIQPPTPSNAHAVRLIVLDLAQQQRDFGFRFPAVSCL
jgi:hypothetical protein